MLLCFLSGKLFLMTIGWQPQRNVPCVWSIAYHPYEIVGRQLWWLLVSKTTVKTLNAYRTGFRLLRLNRIMTNNQIFGCWQKKKMLRDMTTCKVVWVIIVMFKKIIKTLNSISSFNYSSKWRWNAYQLSLPHTYIVQNLTKQFVFFFATEQYHIVTHLVWVHDKRIDT